MPSRWASVGVLRGSAVWDNLLEILGMESWIVKLCCCRWGDTWLKAESGLGWSLATGGSVLVMSLDRLVSLGLLSQLFDGCCILSNMGWSSSIFNFSSCNSTFVSRRSSSDWRVVMFSISKISVDLMALVMICSAWFWILLMLVNLLFAAVAHARAPYWNTGRVIPV